MGGDLVLPPGVAVAIARQDAFEAEQDRREQIDREIERQDRQEMLALDDARFEAWHGYSRQELIAHYASQPESARDGGAEYGSEQRPAVMVGGEAIPAREQAAGAQRSSQARELDARLERAYAVSRDPYMTRVREDWHQREIARRQPAAYSEITRITAGGRMGQPVSLYSDEIVR